MTQDIITHRLLVSYKCIHCAKPVDILSLPFIFYFSYYSRVKVVVGNSNKISRKNCEIIKNNKDGKCYVIIYV